MKQLLLMLAFCGLVFSATAQDSRGIPSTSTQATTGQVMTWDGTLNTWKPATPAAGGANTAFGIVAGNIRITDGAGSLDLPVISVAPVQSVVAGTGGVTVTSASGVFTVNNTDPDQLATNEGSLTVGAGTSTTSIINSNTSGSTGVTLTAGTGLSIAETGNVITLTNSAPDQTVSITGAGISAITGTYPSFTVTSTEVDGSTTNEGSLTVAAGTSTTSVINSNTSGQTGVTITAGNGLTIAETGNVITLTASGAGLTTVTGSTSAQANTNYGGSAGTEFLWDDGFSVHRMIKK